MENLCHRQVHRFNNIVIRDKQNTYVMKYYAFNSKILTHILFWISYFLLFGFIWTREGNYLDAYALEFVLLPVRIMAVYVMIYMLIPRFLEKEQYLKFGLGYVLLLFVGGLLQTIIVYFYRDMADSIVTLSALIRNVVLVNSTVVVIGSFKIFKLWQQQHAASKAMQRDSVEVIEMKADKRTYRLRTSDILYLESLGNYVTYHLKDKRLISYTSLSECASRLPENFMRIHKSYIVNRENITSYNAEDIEVGDKRLPIGRAFRPWV
ncbi:MAG TPA: LytTR family DNA-binding domain-containing protein [Chryseolinea sp.]